MTASGAIRIASPSGLAFQVNANGSIVRIDHRDVIVNAFLGNELEGGPANLFLRSHGDRIAWTPLLGPRSLGRVSVDARGLDVEGEWHGVRFRVTLALAASAPAWFWHVALQNTSGIGQAMDLVYAQDLALADYGMTRINEWYVSQYVDLTPLTHPERGAALAARQNLSIGGRHPWAMIGSLAQGTSFCTDALQLLGLAAREGRAPIGLEAERLPGVRRQHEHSMAVLQDDLIRLAPGTSAKRGFFGWFEADHVDASSNKDLVYVDRALALPEAGTPPEPKRAASGSTPASRNDTLFSDCPLLEAIALDPAELDACFGSERRCIERDGDRLLSFFTASDTHVVLAAKQRAGLRSHGQILRTGTSLVPEEASLTTTVWMNGVFHSMVTQGHVSINRFLSTTHGYLGHFRSHGQRVFVELDGGWQLLDEPSACAMTPSSARWLYKHADGLIEVRSWAGIDRHELWLAVRVIAGPACRFLVSNHVALYGDDGSLPAVPKWERHASGITFGLLPDTDLGRRFPHGTFRIDWTPATAIERVGGDELLFIDGRSRTQPFVVLVSRPTTETGLRITAQLVQAPPRETAEKPFEHEAANAAAAARFWQGMTGPLAIRSALDKHAFAAVERLEAVLPWFAHDALIHYLAPRGLEQYTGGGWGSRDVSQGPVELLLALGRFAPVRDLLQLLFSNQNPDGDWPQWFTFFARERNLRGPDSHGDIIFWPLLALAEHVIAADDVALLDEKLPFFHPEGDARAEHATVLGHVERAIAMIESRAIPGTSLTAYGHGDWNDTLQPVDPAVAARLCSAWTVTLHYQAFAALAEAVRRAGRAALATSLDATLGRIRDDFQRLLVVDGVVVGLARFHEDGRIEPWLHPNDRGSEVRYSVLAMIHAVLAQLFTREQAERHLAIIRDQLLGTDGVRLFDRPFTYRGGLQLRFQRAESSPFFGREVGNMYMHAHLRYAEALARLGHADAFFLALQQANPVCLREVVPNARLRQANCYASSSDADFPDRYEASAGYDAVKTGDVAVEGGWRVYSSGPGIALRLVRECLLGLRLRQVSLGIDPVLPKSLDGLEIEFELAGHSVHVRYRVGRRGYGPVALTLNGAPLPFVREDNPYREGGVGVDMHLLRERLRESGNDLTIELG